MLYAARRSDDHAAAPRVGVVTGRRVGNAVTRNRAKRRVRESLRRLHPCLPRGWDLVFIVRPRAAHARFDEIDAAARELLSRLGLLEAEQPCEA